MAAAAAVAALGEAAVVRVAAVAAKGMAVGWGWEAEVAVKAVAEAAEAAMAALAAKATVMAEEAAKVLERGVSLQLPLPRFAEQAASTHAVPP